MKFFLCCAALHLLSYSVNIFFITVTTLLQMILINNLLRWVRGTYEKPVLLPSKFLLPVPSPRKNYEPCTQLCVTGKCRAVTTPHP